MVEYRRPERPEPPAGWFALSLSRGGKDHVFCLPGYAFYTLFGLIPLLAAGFIAFGAYEFFHDNILFALVHRQNSMQIAYEDRLASLRGQVDRVTSRQLLDQDSFEGKVSTLISRQAQLEMRTSVVSSLAELAGVSRETTASISPIPAMTPSAQPQQQALVSAAGLEPNPAGMPAVKSGMPPKPKTVLRQKVSPEKTPQTAAPTPAPSAHTIPASPATANLPTPEASARFVPLESSPTLPKSFGAPKPRPETASEFEPLPETGATFGKSQHTSMSARPRLNAEMAALRSDTSLPVGTRIASMKISLDQIELEQVRTLNRMHIPLKASLGRMQSALEEAGISPSDLTGPQKALEVGSAMGGPFVPLKVDPKASPFEREVNGFQTTLMEAMKLRAILPALPIRAPVPYGSDVTSSFGMRVDPFLGRMAMHTGIDFRQDSGTPVRATASGKIVSAGPDGGYGNMVEIEHGNNLASLYGHLSAILVSEGQWVEKGAIIGKVGSTGRSTGPHLHYEVRVNDSPVNPERFLRAGTRLAAGE